jgi:hypothetical protein
MFNLPSITTAAGGCAAGTRIGAGADVSSRRTAFFAIICTVVCWEIGQNRTRANGCSVIRGVRLTIIATRLVFVISTHGCEKGEVKLK